MIGLPPAEGGQKGHTVSISLGHEKCLSVLVGILRERSRGGYSLGTKGDPTQWQLDEILKALRARPAKSDEDRKEAEELLEAAFRG